MTRVARAATPRGISEFGRVDTCCIDKTSSADLSEAINSMYRWYGKADVYYAYLSDVDVDIGPELFLSTTVPRKNAKDYRV